MSSGGKANTEADRVWQMLVGFVMDSRGDWRRRIAATTGLPFTRVRALKRLLDGPRTLVDLADAMDSDAPAATVIVNDLEKRGLVARRAHPEDKRAKLVSITAAGRKVINAARTVTDPAPDALANLAPEDLARLLQILAPLAKR